MSAPELPDDLSRWPSNPYQLLGVAAGVSTSDLRKAYTRLIRRFKPEQSPDHFRRIREAYDQITQHLRFFHPSKPREPTPPSEPDAGPEPELLHAPREVPREDTPEELWRWACDGREAEAYRRLCELAERQPLQADVAVRLYWLSRGFPALARQRTACDWLVEALVRHPSGPLRELYRREVAAMPVEGLGARFDRLLRAASPRSTVELLSWRWQAASRLERWPLLGEDLDRFRPLLQAEDEELWLRLLLLAAEQLVLGYADRSASLILRRCGEEARALDHLSTRHADLFDQLEVLVDTGPALASLAALDWARALAPVLAAWGTRPFLTVRPGLEAFLDQVVTAPREALGRLDQLCQRASVLMPRLLGLLDAYEDHLEDGPPCHEGAMLDEVVREFLPGPLSVPYEKWRWLLLDFCLAEGVTPEEVAVRVRNGFPIQAERAEAIERDLPLRAVCRGYRLFAG